MRKFLVPVFYQRTIAAALIIVLFNLGVAQNPENTKKENELIGVDVLVKDAEGKRVLDLKKEDFEIYEDGVLQEITDFKPANQPLRLVLLFDMSNSMGFIFRAIKDEAVKLVEGLNHLDEVLVASYDTDLEWRNSWSSRAVAAAEIQDLESGSVSEVLTERPFPIPRRRRPDSPDKNTNFYGAMHTLFERVGGRGGNEVVLLFSDGRDSVDGDLAKRRTAKDAKQVIQKAQESWAQVYAACFKIERITSGLPSPIDKIRRDRDGPNCKLLTEISDATGGRSFEFGSQPDLALVLKKIFDELRSQYRLAYSPSSQGNRVGYHKIKTVVKRPNVVARAREGYLISK
jgi:Ca-activated chloride channel homolog